MPPARTTLNAAYVAGLVDVQGPCTTPLDAALDYSRARIERVLPMYVLAMAPHAAFAILLIDEIAAGRRSRLVMLSVGLLVATLWRWVWLARLQYNILIDLRETEARPFWARLPAILWTRAGTNFAISWGSLLFGVPAFYGLFLGGFAAPLLIESDTPTPQRLREGLSWIHHAGRRLFRVTLVMTVLWMVAMLATFVSQLVLTQTVLPTLLGIDTADLAITLGSWAWGLRVCYGVCLALDAFWTVACVFLYFDSQSRRTAPDLRARLADLTRTAA